MNYRDELQLGIARWVDQDYQVATRHLLQGVDLFGKADPVGFFLKNLTPGTAFLRTICDALEGDRLWTELHPSFSRPPFPHGSYHVGWMNSLLIALLGLTMANWSRQRNARGYLAMVEVDDLYLSTLGSLARRTAHRRRSAPVFEQALGKALAWDVETGATIAEHLSSPVAKDILGSLHAEGYDIRHRSAEAEAIARSMTIDEQIDSWQQRVQRVAALIGSEGLEALLAERTDQFSELVSFLGRFNYNEMGLDLETGLVVRGVPQADAARISQVLRQDEALILTSAYETSSLFFVLSSRRPVRCYRLDNLSFGYDERVAKQFEEIDIPLHVLYRRIAWVVSPMLDCLGVTLTGVRIRAEQVSRQDAKYLDLGLVSDVPHVTGEALAKSIERLNTLRHVPRYEPEAEDRERQVDDTEADELGAELDQYATVFWVTSFPLNTVPLNSLQRSARHPTRCSYLPSGSVLVGLRGLHKEHGPIRTALIYGNPTRDLPRCSEEGRAVRDCLEILGVRVVLKDGQEATRQFFVDHAAEFDSFHYCGHGCGQDQVALNALLLLADGPLKPRDLVQARPFLRFAFLNSCWSGQQKTAPHGEITGAAGAFLAAGTATVLSPILPVTDRAAAEISGCFYEGITAGMSVGDATTRMFAGGHHFQESAQLVYRLFGLPETLFSKH